MLPDAIARIRDCALGGNRYVNPWTQVLFEDWQPLTTTQVRFLRPSDTADQASAYEAVMELYRTLRLSPHSTIRMDLVGLQPSLADFKLVVGERQYLVQHKLDATIRAMGSSLRRVTIARGDGAARQHHFSCFDRYVLTCHAICGGLTVTGSTFCGFNLPSQWVRPEHRRLCCSSRNVSFPTFSTPH